MNRMLFAAALAATSFAAVQAADIYVSLSSGKKKNQKQCRHRKIDTIKYCSGITHLRDEL